MKTKLGNRVIYKMLSVAILENLLSVIMEPYPHLSPRNILPQLPPTFHNLRVPGISPPMSEFVHPVAMLDPWLDDVNVLGEQRVEFGGRIPDLDAGFFSGFGDVSSVEFASFLEPIEELLVQQMHVRIVV